MNWFGKDRWRRDADHLQSSDLIQFLDGELDANQAAEVSRHLQSCWDCRQRKAELEAAIQGFMTARLADLSDSEGAFRRTWASFRGRTLRLRPRRRSRPLVFRLAAAAASVALALLVWRVSSQQSLSAKELLAECRQASQLALEGKARPVVRQKLLLTRKGRTAAVDLIHDGFGKKLAAPSDNDTWREFERILESNGIQGVPPLSVEAVEAWRANAAIVRDEVRRVTLNGGERAWRLVSIANAGGRPDRIVESVTTFRESDMHPVEQDLKLSGDREHEQVRLVETSFEVVEFASLPATFFATGTTSQGAPPSPIAGASLAGMEPATTLDLEVEVLASLHDAGSCGGEIVVLPSADGGLIVRGLVEDRLHRGRILSGLPKSAKVRVELSSGGGAARTNDASIEVRDITPSPAASAFERLRPDLQHRDAIAIAGKALVSSQSVLAEAWSLKRLADEFAGERFESLSPHSAAALNRIATDHANRLRNRLIDYRGLLETALPALPAAGRPMEHVSEWRLRASELQAAAQVLDDHSRRVFAGPNSASSDPTRESQLLASALLAIESILQ